MALRDTPGGYNIFDVMSALQKCIRRGMEYEAYWWAHELIANKQATLVWRRLLTIACEDIGPGDPSAVCVVQACRQAWEDICTRKDEDGNLKIEWSILAHAIIHLCRAPKSRSADDLSHLVWLRKTARNPETRDVDPKLTPESLEIPGFALDMHTQRGRLRIDELASKSGKDPDAVSTKLFREEGARLNKPVRDVSQDGVNWTEEVCKAAGVDVDLAFKPTEEGGES